MNQWDDIVIGAGSSGAVIASRLSETPGRRVLLLEAGADHPDVERMPLALLDPNAIPREPHCWRLVAQLRNESRLSTARTAGGTLAGAGLQDQWRMARTALSARGSSSPLVNFEYLAGKVVGGSSAVNGALALRGLPEDYDEWATFSGNRWHWQRVQSCFRDLEDDCDGAHAARGRGGPVPVRRDGLLQLAPLQRAFLEACKRLGHPVCEDHNDPQARGVGIVPKTVRGGRRMSTALTHLATARDRTNLRIEPHAHVHRLLWNGARTSSGVEVLLDGKLQRLNGRRVIVCAGAFGTPALLMRSGVGDAQALEALGIHVRLALRGVGRNLCDHPTFVLWAVPAVGACQAGEPFHQVMLRQAAEAGTGRNDLLLQMLGGVDTRDFPHLAGVLGVPLAAGISVGLMKPRSRGLVELVSADPGVPPRVTVSCLQDEADVTRLMAGVRLAWSLVSTQPLAALISRVFALTGASVGSDAALRRVVLTFARPSWHPVGTARMGTADDPDAVVDATCRLHGTDNVWVVDASVMPTIPAAPTNLSCIMLAECIAQELAR